MGTPQFACPALQRIIDDKNFEIVAVLTRQPQVANRGHKITNSPIHDLANKNNLAVLTPITLRSAEIAMQLRLLNADIGVVVAYGLILPLEILSIPKFGCINLHPSLLPRWRGASPIQRTIFAGDLKTGVDIIQMDQRLDSGDILLRKEIDLTIDETYKNLANRLSVIGAEAITEVLNIFKNSNKSAFKIIKQDPQQAIYASKILKEECKINWQNNALSIYRQVKALSGSLGSYFDFNDEKIKIHDVKLIDEEANKFQAGTILSDRFLIQCGKGIIQPLILQRQGKNPLPIDEFLRGFSLQTNQILT